MTTCPTGSGFDPSSMVEAFHSIPHTDIDLQDSPDQFEPSNGHYWEAVVIWGCVPILVCVCILILMSIYFICVCCCCCGGSLDWSKKPKIGCGIVNFSIIAVLLALIGASIWAEVELDKHANEIIDRGWEVEDFFNQYNSDSALYNEGTQNESLAALETVLSGQRPEPTTQLQEVAVLTRANVELGSVYGDINGLVDPIDLDNALSYTENQLEAVRHWVVIGYLCVAVVILLLLVWAILCGICVSNPAFLIIVVVVLACLTFAMWVGAGGSLTLLVVVGDICSDPDMLLRNLTQDQTDAVDLDVVNYYLVCNETCQPSPFTEYVMTANTTFTIINAIEAELQNYTTNNVNKSSLQPPLDEVIAGFNGSRTGVDEISSCGFIHDIYLNILQSLCGDAYDAAVAQFGLVCALCVGLMVLVVTATFHTGLYCNRRNEYDEETTAFEFPATTTGVWQSYGTNVNYNSASYSRYRDESHASSSRTSEPPKYNDLQRPAGGRNAQYNELHEISDTSSNRPRSGSYDHT